MVKILGLGCFGASGTPSDDEVELESSSFVGENAGDCGLWDLGGDGGLYSGWWWRVEIIYRYVTVWTR